VALSIVLGGTVLAGCGKQSELSPHSPVAHDISLLWWWMLGAAGVVLLGTLALLAIAWIRREQPGLPFLGEREHANEGLVVVFGIAIPLVVLVALFGAANVYLVGKTGPPSPRSTAMTIDVIGHQWWWEVRYPGSNAVTANEIHIPTRTRVDVVAESADVIHSFWVPMLARKIDMIPGRENRVLLYASQAGRYRGQCAEFCGLQHANMGLFVIAQPPAAFRSWLAHVAAPAPQAGASVARGAQLFMTLQCASCHRIAGTSATGTVGPDLTHLASRRTLAAAEIPNDAAHLTAWISDPQAVKPGDRMPDLGLSKPQVAAIVSYLESLK
jgi:cytochrome c oxidase subunit 2